MTDSLPVLMPQASLLRSSDNDWVPTRYKLPPGPPPMDEHRQDIAIAAARQLIDGKALKKTRPRRTVDYGGAMGHWIMNRKSRPSPNYIPYIRPAPPFIVDLLPPKAYPNNPSTSLTTKFIHTSTNKIRCPVNCVVWTPEGRRVLTGSTSGEFTLWNGLTFNFETILQAHDSAIRTLRFTHAGTYLASADQSGVIKYFQPNMNNLTAWQAHREAVRDISFAPDDRRFATASDDSTVRIWDFEESKEERVLSGHGWDVRCVQWHPTKGLLASGSKDNLVKFWDPRTGTCLSTLHHHKNTIQALGWSPNGDLVATASRDQTVRLFDIRAMKEFRVLKGHKKEVCSLAWHPLHPILVTGGSEGSLLYWDTAAPEPPFSALVSSASSSTPPIPGIGPRATLAQAHDSNVWSLAFHPLGHLLASASNDHTTRFWARERPGDATSTFSGGGARPPPQGEGEGVEEEDGGDEEEMMALPGFAFIGQQQHGQNTSLNQSHGQDGSLGWESQLPGLSGINTVNGSQRRNGINAGSGAESVPGLNASIPGLGGNIPGLSSAGGGDDGGLGIPGLGRSVSQENNQRQGAGQNSSQDDGYGGDWNGGGGQLGNGARDRDRDRGYSYGRGGGTTGTRGGRWSGQRRGRY